MRKENREEGLNVQFVYSIISLYNKKAEKSRRLSFKVEKDSLVLLNK